LLACIVVIVVLEVSAVHGGLRQSCVICKLLCVSEPCTLCVHCGAVAWSTSDVSKTAYVTAGVAPSSHSSIFCSLLTTIVSIHRNSFTPEQA